LKPENNHAISRQNICHILKKEGQITWDTVETGYEKNILMKIS
jgi:hypothetical protein